MIHRRAACHAAVIAAVGIAVVMGPRDASAETIVDQSNESATTTNWNLRNLAPMGQEFTPTFDGMNFVDVIISDAGGDIGPGADFHINIREGTIDGAILGTSLTTFVADGTNTGGGLIETRFLFDAIVSLTPGALHVFEVVHLGPFIPETGNFMLRGARANSYFGGRGILNGTPDAGIDFFFRTGLTGSPGVIPEPSSITLAGLGAVGGLLAWGRRRRVVAPAS